MCPQLLANKMQLGRQEQRTQLLEKREQRCCVMEGLRCRECKEGAAQVDIGRWDLMGSIRCSRRALSPGGDAAAQPFMRLTAHIQQPSVGSHQC